MQNNCFDANPYLDWKPNEKIYKTIVAALTSSCSSSSTEVQAEVLKILKDFNETVADAALYYLHLFMNKGEKSDVRQVAGILLKNYVSAKNKYLTVPILKIIKNEIFKLVEDEIKDIRSTAGSVITTILTKYEGIQKWPEALYNLILLIDQGNKDVIDGAFRTIIIIIEDELNNKKNYNSVFFQFCKTHLLDKIFLYCGPNEKSIKKKYATKCLDLFISANCFNVGGVFEEYFPQLWECLGYLASEKDSDILKSVVSSMTTITDSRYASIFSNLDAVIQFMVNATNSSDRKVQLEALEFWPVLVKDRSYLAYNANYNKVPCSSTKGGGDITKSDQYMDEQVYKTMNDLRKEALKTLKNYLPYLCKILIDNTVYTKWDFITMDESHFNNDNASVPDLAQDISPEMYKNSTNAMMRNREMTEGGGDKGEKQGDRSSNDIGVGKNGEAMEEEEEEEDEEDLEEDDEGGEMNGKTWGNDWTVRKGAALCLDFLSNTYNNEILEFILPHIEQKLMSDEWEIRESAVLTLGAIAKGCMNSLDPFVPKVLEYLLKLLNDEKPLARSISCWCVARFTTWICDPENCDKWFEPVLLNLLKRILDSNKRVQEAACSSFANLEEGALDLLIGYLPEIVHTILQAFQVYQSKNYFILFDVVSTLIDSVHIVKENRELAHQIAVCIMSKWDIIRMTSPYIIALMECMSCMISAYGEEFLKYSEKVIRTCVKFLVILYIDLEEEIKYYYSKKMGGTRTYLVNRNNISTTAGELLNYYKITEEEYFAYMREMEIISPSKKKDLIECCFDLISRILSVINSHILDIINNPENNFIPLVHKYCMNVNTLSLDVNKMNHNVKMMNMNTETKTGIMVKEECLELGKEFLNYGILQSNFALIGDISRFCSSYMIPYLDDIIPFLIIHITHQSIPVSNNASWAIGELSINISPEYLEVYVDEIIKHLICVCQNAKYHGCLLQNICIILGRISSVYPKKMIYYIPQYLKSWLEIMGRGSPENEKIHAFKAILETLYLNLDIAAENLIGIVYIIVKYRKVSHNVHVVFHQFLSTMKQKYPTQWESIYQCTESSILSKDMLTEFKARFNL